MQIFLIVIIILFIVVGITSAILFRKKSLTFPFLYCIQKGYYCTLATTKVHSPLIIDKDKLQIIDWKDKSYNPPIRFMADPFVVEQNGVYYILYEELNFKLNAPGADIAALRSTNLVDWEYLGIVLREPFHLSYPFVFKQDEKWYMIPESIAVNEVRLYESSDFPYKWKFSKTLLNKDLADSTIIIQDDIIYLLGMDSTDESLRLYYTENLYGEWIEHPCSPVRTGHNNEIRPGGRPVELDGRLIYFIQDNTYGYGTGVVAYEILSLTQDDFRDVRLETNPVLFRFDEDWAASGMHHISCLKVNKNDYFCVVDGISPEHPKEWRFSLKNLPELRL